MYFRCFLFDERGLVVSHPEFVRPPQGPMFSREQNTCTQPGSLGASVNDKRHLSILEPALFSDLLSRRPALVRKFMCTLPHTDPSLRAFLYPGFGTAADPLAQRCSSRVDQSGSEDSNLVLAYRYRYYSVCILDLYMLVHYIFLSTVLYVQYVAIAIRTYDTVYSDDLTMIDIDIVFSLVLDYQLQMD